MDFSSECFVGFWGFFFFGTGIHVEIPFDNDKKWIKCWIANHQHFIKSKCCHILWLYKEEGTVSF